MSEVVVADGLVDETAKRGAAVNMDAPSEPWLVALDIDGTVMHEDETIDEEVISAIQLARKRGHLVTLATGRSWSTTKPVLELLQITPEYVVCANGAVTMRRPAGGDYYQYHIETFDPSTVLERIQPVLPGGRFMVELEDGYRLYTKGMREWNLENAREVEFNELLGKPATRVVVTSIDHDTDEFLELVAGMGLHHVSYAIGWTAWLDIAPDNVNKATALKRVCQQLSWPKHRVLVAGDGRNDIEMMRWAGRKGRAVAMGQAPDEVKDAANESTTSVAEYGLVAVLNSLP